MAGPGATIPIFTLYDPSNRIGSTVPYSITTRYVAQALPQLAAVGYSKSFPPGSPFIVGFPIRIGPRMAMWPALTTWGY